MVIPKIIGLIGMTIEAGVGYKCLHIFGYVGLFKKMIVAHSYTVFFGLKKLGNNKHNKHGLDIMLTTLSHSHLILRNRCTVLMV